MVLVQLLVYQAEAKRVKGQQVRKGSIEALKNRGLYGSIGAYRGLYGSIGAYRGLWVYRSL